MKLPPLPEYPDEHATGWTESEKTVIRLYGQRVALAVREACADFCDTEYRTPDGWGLTAGDMRCAKGIRTMEFET